MKTYKSTVLSEDVLRKTQAATIIARSLGYTPTKNETPNEIIEKAIAASPEMTPVQLKTLQEMMKLAESIGLDSQDTGIYLLTEASDEDDMSDEDIDDMIKHIDDWDDIMDVYEPGELGIIDDETGEEVQGDLSDELKESELNEVLSRVERIRARMRFHRTASKRERKLKIALKKKSNNTTINHRARRLAVKTMETRLAKGRPVASLSIPEKERIERIIQKRSNMVGRMALKLTSRIRNIERTRLSHNSYTK